MATYVINAGHAPFGCPDPGAVGLNGLRECDVAIDIANMTVDFLKKVGHDAYVVQDDNLEQICSFANGKRADYFVSVHCNAAENLTATGMEVWVFPGAKTARRFGEFVANQMTSEFPHLPQRGVKEGKLYVLLHTQMPAILVETAFISNPKEEELLSKKEFRRKFAAAIARGCTDIVS